MRHNPVKTAVAVMAAAFLLTFIVLCSGSLPKPCDPPVPDSSIQIDEYRAVWFSYTDLQAMLVGKSEAQFRAEVEKAFAYCAGLGLNRVILQVRPFSDALYDSSIFPSSQYAVGKQGAAMSYDPLDIMVQTAKQHGLKTEAWINPYRVALNAGQTPCDTNPAAGWVGTGKVIPWGTGLYYDPSDSEVQALILNGAEEILQNYGVDGIHFDDYFYPSGVKDSFDAESYKAYTASGGSMPLSEWRIQNVNALIRQMYELCHRYGKTFTISPQGNVGNCYGLAADVKTWAAESGYCDYLVPQIYWGYDHPLENARFDVKIKEWSDMVTCKDVSLVFGLAAYRIGQEDHGFHAIGDDMANMVRDIRTLPNGGGFCLFRYGSLNDDTAKTEMSNLKTLLQTGG